MSLLRILMVFMVMAAFPGCSNKTEEQKANDDKNEKVEVSKIIEMDTARRKMAEIQIDEVRLQSIKQRITLPGRVDFDQSRVAHLTSRVAGRVEQVYAYLGDKVTTNQLVATIYSQEYLTAQSEFLQAVDRLNRAQQRRDSLEMISARSIYESVKKKLLVIGANEQNLKELTDSRIPQTLLHVYTPLGGTVTETGEILGHTVDIGTTLFHIADLTNVWVIVDVYEKDIQFLTTNMEATVEMTAYYDKTFKGLLSRIFDVVDENTRTMKARIEVHNNNHKLKPGMFVSASLFVQNNKEVMTVPTSAIQRDGDERYVFIATSHSTFEKRIVVTGKETQDWVEILNGLDIGERVVTKGAFTLKSEYLKETFGEGE